MKASNKAILDSAFDDLKAMMLADSAFRKKYENGFDMSELSAVLGDGVMSYSNWLEELDKIESRVKKVSPIYVREEKAKQGILEFIEERKKIYTNFRNYFSSNPRTFRRVEE